MQFRQEPSPRILQIIGICLTIELALVIVCHQVSGYSEDSLPGVQHLLVGQCDHIELLEKKFDNFPDFNPKEQQYEEWLLYCSDNVT
ncbi:MAG: hypothetical protein ACOYXT_12960 [Bacteroidota bacterium]